MQDAQKRNGASGKGAASALISNVDTLARVLRARRYAAVTLRLRSRKLMS